ARGRARAPRRRGRGGRALAPSAAQPLRDVECRHLRKRSCKMAKRALIVIDVQNEYFDGALPISDPPNEESLENIGRAMEAATDAGVPVIVVRHGTDDPSEGIFLKGSHAWELHPEIERRPRDFLIDKTLPGSFTDTELGSVLEEAGVDTVAITGYMTHM